MDKKKKILIAAGAGLGLALMFMAGGSKNANAAPAVPDDDEDDEEPIQGPVPDGQEAGDLDDVVNDAGDILDNLPIPQVPPPVVVQPQPVSPPPFVGPLPGESGPPLKLPIPAPRPKPAKPRPPVVLPDLPDLSDLPELPDVEDILVPAPITLPPPGEVTPAPPPDDIDPVTLAMLRYLLAREHDADWKELDIPVVRDWQRHEGLVVDGKFGPTGALHLAEQTGLLPIIRAWPRGTFPEKHLPEFRNKLRAVAAEAEEPRRTHLLAATEREKGQAFGTPPKPVTVYIDGV